MSTRGPKPTVSDDELIDAIRMSDRPFATAADVAKRVNLSDWRVRQRLERIGEQGHSQLNIARIGGGPLIYWLDGSFSSEAN